MLMKLTQGPIRDKLGIRRTKHVQLYSRADNSTHFKVLDYFVIFMIDTVFTGF